MPSGRRCHREARWEGKACAQFTRTLDCLQHRHQGCSALWLLPVDALEKHGQLGRAKVDLAVGRLRQMKRPCSNLLANMHRPSPLDQSSLMTLPRRPRNAKTWPLNGSSSNALSTLAARPLNPQRMSVKPAAIQMRVPAGSPIIRADSGKSFLTAPHRRPGGHAPPRRRR